MGGCAETVIQKTIFTKCKQYKLVAPEGGWGFLIMLGLAASFVSFSIFFCFYNYM